MLAYPDSHGEKDGGDKHGPKDVAHRKTHFTQFREGGGMISTGREQEKPEDAVD